MSSGAIVNKTPSKARQVISNMVKNSQQFGTQALKNTTLSQEVSDLKTELAELPSLVKQALLVKAQAKEHVVEVNYAGNQQGGQ